jgi:hypothetical protein
MCMYILSETCLDNSDDASESASHMIKVGVDMLNAVIFQPNKNAYLRASRNLLYKVTTT